MSQVELVGVLGDALRGAELTFDGGLCFVVGAPADGTVELVELLSGARAPRRGVVRVDGADPYRSPALRRRIGALLADERLPAATTVERAVSRVLVLRGEDGARARDVLGEVGLAAWDSRRTGSLSHAESRSVALALALSQREPALVVLHEPFADCTGVDRAKVRAAIGAQVESGRTVLCTTASARDAIETPGTVLVLEQGRFTRRAAAPLPTELAPGVVPDLLVRTPEPRRLLARLVLSSAVTGADWDERAEQNEIRVRGPDVDQVARAVARAARDEGIRIEALAPTLPALELVRAASAGQARAAYETAYRLAVGPARARAGEGS